MGVNMSKVAKRAHSYEYVLIVMRHGKAEAFGKGDDRQRQLTDKGVKQAKSVAKGLESLNLIPDRIACSGADRTRQTLERMLRVFGDKPKVDMRQSLYEGGVQAILDELQATKTKRKVLMIVGHEPTVSISCQWLATSDSDPERLDLLNLGMSPANLAIFGSNEPFKDWQIHSANLLAVLGPHDF
ncbi:MAG: histidine phosphatase family protein [Bifidobacterium sp.]|jgi:phosphohistidine phosphatase|nr:histidine phosphatase family protein [Bifidobacterium sp.]MCH4174389.1 histidine phosphatase family protein [Bifidobacterium sp.]